MPVPYTFGTATTSIPLSNLDANFNTPVTIGSTTVGLGNTVTTVANLTLTNATISSGNVTVTTGIFGAGSNTAPSITTTGDTNTGIFFPAADTIAFTEGGVESMRIDSSGNVGIGNTTPSSYNSFGNQLVVGGSGDKGMTIVSGTTNYGSIHFADGTSGADSYRGQVVYNHSNNAMSFSTDATERMRIDSSGNVGIGTGSPASRLSVTGSANIATFDGGSTTSISLTGSSRSDIFLIDSGAATDQKRLTIRGDGGILIFGVENDAVTTFTERMRIDSSGRAMINTTTQGARFTVAASSGDQQAAAFFSNNSTLFNIALACGQGSVQMYLASVSTTDESVKWINSGGGEVARIINNGDFTIQGATATKSSGTTWANPSDSRLKDNIADYTKGLAELQQVNVKTWEYNGKAGTKLGTKGLGVIADEIMQVLPETIDTYKAKLNADDETETDVKRFDATEITWLLVNAVKEQQAMIEELKQEVALLKSK